jgi:hypothetical protein
VKKNVTLILALDLATVCGFAVGEVGSTPTSGSIRFGAYGSNNNVVFGNAIKWISQFLEPQPRPRILILESMLPPDAMKGKTNRGTRDRLAGLHGIMRGVAHLRGIREITEVSVSDVRGHFIGHRGAKRDLAKSETRERCKRLGWGDVDADAADACAVWHFACSLIDPRLALQTSPLFERRIAP